MSEKFILADGRWRGPHGIGRFAKEVLSRLQHTDILNEGPLPLSHKSLVWLSYQLYKNKKNYKIFFTPGFNPILRSPIPFVMTICDLIHLKIPGKAALLKKIYYETFLKSAIKKAFKIITISEYSKQHIMQWTDAPSEKIINVGCGISLNFLEQGPAFQPGYPYFLYVGNVSKPHKNIHRLIQAFAIAKIDPGIKLILTGKVTSEFHLLIKKNKLENRIIWSDIISEDQLVGYYRGAEAILFPSLYEGFGLPILEAWASKKPILTSNVTALPEIAGEGAILVNPYEIESIATGIETILYNTTRRNKIISVGSLRQKLFSWDKTAEKIQQILASQK